MKTIKIINGAYGQRVNGHTVTVRLGQTCQVDDAEAERLIKLGVAALAEAAPPKSKKPAKFKPAEAAPPDLTPEAPVE